MKKYTEKQARQAIGSKGGRCLVAKRGKEYMKKLGKKAAAARWGKRSDQEEKNNK